MGAHDHHMHPLLSDGLENFWRCSAHHIVQLVVEPVALEKFLDRIEHPLGLLPMVLVDGARSDHALDPGRHRRLHMEHDQFVLRSTKVFVGNQKSQGFLRKWAAVCREKDLHAGPAFFKMGGGGERELLPCGSVSAQALASCAASGCSSGLSSSARITKTGTGARRMICSAPLPSSTRPIPRRPWVPSTIRSAP